MRVTFWRLTGLLFLILLAAASVRGWRFIHKLEREVVSRFTDHHWAVPSKIYARPVLLYPGLDLEQAALVDQLERLAYHRVPHPIRARGEYWRDPATGDLQIFLRESDTPGRRRGTQRVGVSVVGSRIERLVDLDDETELPVVETEPEVITRLYARTVEERRVVKLHDVPSLLVKAVLATEDQRFFEHNGVDFRRVLGAGWANVLAGRTVQGGSTITQQLVKNFFLTQDRTFQRKLTEVCIALIIESHYSKLQILEYYLNEIYLGQRGSKSIFGVWEAARFYFGKAPRDLSAGEAAILAGMIKAPNRYAPNRHPERALRRRNYVLRRMAERGAITSDEARTAMQEDVGRRETPPERNTAPYFADFIRKRLEARYPAGTLTKAGLNIFTTLDMQLQEFAREAVQQGLAAIETAHPGLEREAADERLQACLIAIQPQTGHILAMVGGRDYRDTQFNRVTQAYRQPGSIFKPVVFLAAIEDERERKSGRYLPTRLVKDDPFTWFYEDKEWRPRNYRNRYNGLVSLQTALARSMNAATARVAQEVGLEATREAAVRLGFPGPLPTYPSLSLGSIEVTPFDVGVAYGTLANQGTYTPPAAITWITSPTGAVIEEHRLTADQRIHPDAAYLLTHLLAATVENGTGVGVRRRGFLRPAAGKTGTTNDYGDAWFAGYTPELLTVVWVGFDQREPHGLSGAAAALPIWTAFMQRATAGTAPAAFTPPPGVTLVAVDPRNGLRATPDCPDAMEVAFPAGQEPLVACPYHGQAGHRAEDFAPPAPSHRNATVPPRPSEPAAPQGSPPAPPTPSRPWWNVF